MKSFMHILSLTAAISLSFQLHGQTLYENVKKAEKRNDHAAVASLYTQWLKLAPNDIGLIYNTANAYYKNNQYQDAIPLFKRAVESATYLNDISAWTNLIDCYDKKGQPENATQYIKQQIDKYPNYPVIFSALSFANIKNKKYEDALLASNRSIELVPQNPVAFFFQGMAYGSLKTYRPAIEALKKSIALYPNFSQAYLFLGRYLIDYKETEEAISTLKKGLAEGENSLLHLMLGLAQFKLGKYTDAYTEIDKALALESKSGIGINIEMLNKYPVIKTIQDYTPAQSAELKPGDIIVDINAKSTKKMKEDGVLELLSSEKGTSLILMLERNGNSFTKTITCSDIPKLDAAISFAMRSIISRYTGNKSQQKEDILIAESLKNDDETTKEYISMAKGLLAMDEGNYETTIQLMTKVPDNSFARMYEAIAFAEKSLFTASLSHYLQIPSEDLVPENIPLMQDNKVLMKLYKPQVVQHNLKAEEFLTNNMPQDALFELSEAVKKTDEIESQFILEKMFAVVAANPVLAEIPETARKFALRSEILLKEGNLEEAVAETRKAILAAPYIASLYYNMALIKSELNKYADAIRYMRIFTKGVPDAPNIRQAKDQIIKWEFMLERSKEK